MTQNRRILIVDDDKSVGEFISSVCHGEGFGLTVTHPAELGLKELEQEGYGLVITGIFMEGTGGMAMIQTIVATMPHIFILAISAGFGDMTSSKTLDAAKKIGAHAVLAKPVSAEDIQAWLAKFFGG